MNISSTGGGGEGVGFEDLGNGTFRFSYGDASISLYDDGQVELVSGSGARIALDNVSRVTGQDFYLEDNAVKLLLSGEDYYRVVLDENGVSVGDGTAEPVLLSGSKVQNAAGDSYVEAVDGEVRINRALHFLSADLGPLLHSANDFEYMLTAADDGSLVMIPAAGGDNISITPVSGEVVQDIVGAMVGGGNTETGITVTYDDAAGKLNFVVAGGAPSAAVKGFASTVYGSAISTGSGSFAELGGTSLRLSVPATAGDIISVDVLGQGDTGNGYLATDIAVLNSSNTLVRRVSNLGNGEPGMYQRGDQVVTVAGSVKFEAQSGDIDGGNVKISLYGKILAGSAKGYDPGLRLTVTNLGPVA